MKFVDLHAQFAVIEKEIRAAIDAVLAHGCFINGPEVAELEKKLADYCGVKHAVGVASGSDALLIALLARGVGAGDAVIVPAFTFAATAEVVALLGATPVFADVDAATFNIAPESVVAAAARVKHAGALNLRGVIAVDLFGLPADYAALAVVAAEHKMFVLADAAQSFGAVRDGKRAGSFGCVGHGDDGVGDSHGGGVGDGVGGNGNGDDGDSVGGVSDGDGGGVGGRDGDGGDGHGDDGVGHRVGGVGDGNGDGVGGRDGDGDSGVGDGDGDGNGDGDDGDGNGNGVVSVAATAFAATSFYPVKPLGCYGDGGALFTDDDATAAAARSIREHGAGDDRYHHIRVGVTGRLDTIQAAVLLCKLRVFDAEIKARRRLADAYTHALAAAVTVPHIPAGCASAWAQYTVRTANRDAVRRRLHDNGVPTAVHYPRALNRQPAYAGGDTVGGGGRVVGGGDGGGVVDGHGSGGGGDGGHDGGGVGGATPVADQLANEVFSLPMHPYLTDTDQAQIIAAVKAAVKS